MQAVPHSLLAPDRRRANPQAAAFVRALRLEVGQWMPEALSAVLPKLREAAQKAPNAGARADLAEAADLLAESGRNWCRALERAVQDGIADDLAREPDLELPVTMPFGQPTEPAPMSLTMSLTLMDEDRIDEEIAVSRLVQVAEVEADGALRELAALCSGLRELPGISPEANPMRPGVVAGALRRAVAGFGLRKPVRLALLRELGGVVGKLLPRLYNEQLALLSGWGVQPAQFTLRLNVDEQATALQRLGAGTADSGDAPAADTAPASVEAQQAGELMARLLTSMASRFTMSEGARALIRRLDAPAQRIAQAEPELWHSLDHPLWQLLDRLVAAGSVHEDMAPTGSGELTGALERAVRALESSQQPDAGQCEAALSAVDTAVSELVEEQQQRVAPAAEALQPPAVPRSAVQDDLREQLRHQARAADAPPGLERFLVGTWAEVLADIAERDGADSEPMRKHAELVDNLIAATLRRNGRPIAPATLGRLLMLVKLAMADARLPATRIEHDLAALQSALCAPNAASAPAGATLDIAFDGAPAAAPPARPEARAAVAAPPPFVPTALDERHSALGLHESLTTVRIDPFDGDEEAAAATASWIDGLAPGTYCRMFLMERWMNAQLIWRSQNGSMFVFKSRHGGHTHSLARRALEKLRAAGLATTIERGEWVAQVVRELAGERRH